MLENQNVITAGEFLIQQPLLMMKNRIYALKFTQNQKICN